MNNNGGKEAAGIFSFGIVTINDYSNYGNRLQNYALAKLLSQYGSVTTIFHSFSGVRKYLGRIKRFVVALYSTEMRAEIERRKKLKNFTKKYIDDSQIVVNKKSLESDESRIKTVVIGSDQVWNPQAVTNDSDLLIRLGGFTKTSKIISYAASFGVSEINEEESQIFKNGFKRISAISVREEAGAKIVKSLTGRDAKVVLDPTLMLTASQWKQLIPKNAIGREPYLLTYFLGKPNESQYKLINDYAKKNSLNIRSILDPTDLEDLSAGIEDFIGLFSQAEMVFTDSYHACCFSIIFGKQFKVFSRNNLGGVKNMNSRIETLFKTFDIGESALDDQVVLPIDYAVVNSVLEVKRKESRDWLESAMKNK